jgi:16S rRNA (cytidine1402-2'-O)-methyltransferase
MSGTLFVVATPIGNLDDITARALRVLGQVALVAAEDTRRTHHLLSRYAITTPTTSLHEHNETQKLPALIDRLKRGESIALVSDAGTPTISDPGQRLVRAAIDAAIRVEPVPGPSALVAALAASGFSGDSVSFLGFPPTRAKDRKAWLASLASIRGLAVFFEAPHRIKATLDEILRSVGDCEVSVGRELTKIHEEFIRGPLSAVIPRLRSPRGEFTVVIDIGHNTKLNVPVPPAVEDLVVEFGRMTTSDGFSKRHAISRLANQHGVSTNVVYAAIEQAKKLVE